MGEAESISCICWVYYRFVFVVVCFFFRFVIYFREGGEAEEEGGRDSQADSSLSMEPIAGLDLTTLR